MSRLQNINWQATAIGCIGNKGWGILLLWAFLVFAAMGCGLFSADDEQGYVSSSLDDRRYFEALISQSDLEAVKFLSGIYEWVERYVFLEDDDGFSRIESSDIDLDSLFSTFRTDGTFSTDVNNPFDPSMYLRFVSGNFAVEEIEVGNISQEKRTYMKMFEDYLGVRWFRVVQYNLRAYAAGQPTDFPDVLLKAYWAVNCDNDIATFLLRSDEFSEHESAFHRRVSPAIDVNLPVIESIAGTFLDNKGYDEESSTFLTLYNYQRKTYEFNLDSGFRIDSFGPVGRFFYKGSFNIERISLANIDSSLIVRMPTIEDREESSLYHVVAYNVMGTSDKPKLELFISIVDDEDVIIYMPALGEAVKARRIW